MDDRYCEYAGCDTKAAQERDEALAEVKRLNALLEQERATSRMLRAALDRIAQKVGEEKDGWGRIH